MIGSSDCVCVGVISDGGLQAVKNSTMQLMTTIMDTGKDVVWLCMIAPQMDMLVLPNGYERRLSTEFIGRWRPSGIILLRTSSDDHRQFQCLHHTTPTSIYLMCFSHPSLCFRTDCIREIIRVSSQSNLIRSCQMCPTARTTLRCAAGYAECCRSEARAC